METPEQQTQQGAQYPHSHTVLSIVIGAVVIILIAGVTYFTLTTWNGSGFRKNLPLIGASNEATETELASVEPGVEETRVTLRGTVAVVQDSSLGIDIAAADGGTERVTLQYTEATPFTSIDTTAVRRPGGGSQPESTKIDAAAIALGDVVSASGIRTGATLQAETVTRLQ